MQKLLTGTRRIIRLSGRLRSEHLDELKTQVGREQLPIALDLEGAKLVGIEIVHFLNAYEKSGVENKHAAKPYPHVALFNHSSQGENWRWCYPDKAVHGRLRLC